MKADYELCDHGLSFLGTLPYLNRRTSASLLLTAYPQRGILILQIGDCPHVTANTYNQATPTNLYDMSCLCLPGCDVTLSGGNGAFSSPSYPSAYQPNADCEWIIEAQTGLIIEITFEVIDLPEPDINSVCLDSIQVRAMRSLHQ